MAPGASSTIAFPSPIGFLVGPNGSGKSRFAEALISQLPSWRFLGTDRLAGMQKHSGLGVYGDMFEQGYPRRFFDELRRSSQFGFGIDAIIILNDDLDRRIRIEATLSHLFNRRIRLDWDEGYLVPKAMLANSDATYRLDSEECHGIKELLILLTHLYDDSSGYLIIDEPELNLHPQLQAFFMQEVRKVAGDPSVGKKVVLLITHSPFILDFRSIDELKSTLSFDLRYTPPKNMANLSEAATRRIEPLVPRLNVHHKQFFFSDNPIFVEGIFDAQMVKAIQECRGISISAAGSCIVDAGGNDEVNRYLELCSALRKEAWFLYDLDSLFLGTLRACIKDDETITDFLAKLGLGTDFGRFCGALERALADAIDQIRAQTPSSVPDLRKRIDQLDPSAGRENLAKARLAVLVQLRGSLSSAISHSLVADIEGKLNQVVTALRQKKILLLPGGAIENYLPSYTGDLFEVPDSAKRTTVEAELTILGRGMSEGDLRARYGDLYRAIESFPGMLKVNIDNTLKEYLGRYINELQSQVVAKPNISSEQIAANLQVAMPGSEKLFELTDYSKGTGDKFSAKVVIKGSCGGGRFVSVSDQANAGMKRFDIEEIKPSSG